MPQTIDRAETRRLLAEEDAQLIEVLPRSQYERAHLPEATSLPLKELSAESVQQLDDERPVVVYCSSFL